MLDRAHKSAERMYFTSVGMNVLCWVLNNPVTTHMCCFRWGFKISLFKTLFFFSLMKHYSYVSQGQPPRHRVYSQYMYRKVSFKIKWSINSKYFYIFCLHLHFFLFTSRVPVFPLCITELGYCANTEWQMPVLTAWSKKLLVQLGLIKWWWSSYSRNTALKAHDACGAGLQLCTISHGCALLTNK